MKSVSLLRFSWRQRLLFGVAWSHTFVLAAGLLAALAAALAWLATPYGANLSPDSVYYLNVADNVCQGRGLVQTAGLLPHEIGDAVPLTVWPPAYPLLLCGLSWLTGSILTAARALSVLAFAGLTVACLALGRECINFNGGVLVALSALLSAPLLRVISFAWSEPLFMFCSVAGWWGMWRAWGTPTKRRRYLLLVAAMWGLAGLTRYLGVVLLACGVVIIAAMPLPRRERWRNLALYTLLALLPYCAWLLRNHILAGHLSGDVRLTSTTGLSQNIWLVADVLLHDIFYPLPLPFSLVLLAFCLASLALAGLGMVIRAGWSLAECRLESASFSARSWLPLPSWWSWLLLYCLAYIAVLVYLASNFQFDRLETRLLVVIYPFLWLLLIAGGTHLYRQRHILVPAWRRQAVGLVWALLLLLALAGQLRGQYFYLMQPPAWVYNAPVWAQDPAVVSLPLSAPGVGVVYTNMPAAMTFIIGQPAYRLPDEDNLAQQEAFFQRHVITHPGYVVWYEDGWEQNASITADTLTRWCARLAESCQLLAAYPHALVYRVG